MMRILITGLPGSGKTTQAKKISEKLGFCLIKTGDILREMAKEESEIGLKLRTILETGEMADDSMVADIVRDQVERDECKKGFVMDGYPRSLEQLKYFDPEFDKVFYLKLDEEASRKRLEMRHREDDTKIAIERRLEIQRNLLNGVLDYYRNRAQVIEIDGSKTIDQINIAIRNHIG